MAFELAIMLVMIAFNSVFAAYEIALASVGAGRLHTLVHEGQPGAAAALRMKEKIEASLAVVQLGITLVGAIAAATGGAGAEESIQPLLQKRGLSPQVSQFLAIAMVVLVLTVFTILAGELLPKVFALRNKEWVCLTLSPAMEWFSYCVWPAVWFFESTVTWIMSWGDRSRRDGEDGLAEDAAIQELHGAAALARISLLIGRREEGIIVSASRLASTPVRRVMLPNEFIDMLNAEQSLTEALVGAHQHMHTRYPVTDEAGNPQRIVGYVNFKDIVATLRLAPHDSSFRSLIRNLCSFDAESSVADCLERLMKDHSHIGLVRERGGKIIGMITLEDILEELVGEIHDEFDRMPSHLTRAGEGWIAGGFVSLTQIRQVTGIDLPAVSDKPVYTLNDWIVESLGHPPHGGDIVTSDSCRIVVRKTRKVLVQEAYLARIEAVAAATSE
jgi:putative hemolysin